MKVSRVRNVLSSSFKETRANAKTHYSPNHLYEKLLERGYLYRPRYFIISQSIRITFPDQSSTYKPRALCTSNDTRVAISCSLSSTLFYVLIFVRACTFECTSLCAPHSHTLSLSLALTDMGSAREAKSEWLLVSGTSLPHSLSHDGDDIALFLPLLRVSFHVYVRARLCTLPISLSFFLSRSLVSSSPFLSTRRSKEAKVEANHHAITAPGAAGTPTRSQKAATAFCRPGGIHHRRGTAAAKPTIFVLCRGKKEHCPHRALPSSPRSFSPNHPEGRPIVRLLASGESIARE